MRLAREFKIAFRSLTKARGLSAAVIVTLALGIGVNAAIFSLVRTVLLRPLVNREEQRILYLRQSAPGIGARNTTFSVPEIQDLRTSVRSLSDIGEFSTLTFTMIGLGEPRQVRAGVVNGAYFDVMGLRPVLGRLLSKSDDGPAAAGAAVLTYQFWRSALNGDRTVIGKTIRLETRSAEVVGVLEPSVPYPAETELIANIVTSPHHLSATMVTGREHRMTEVFGRLAPGANLDAARNEITTAYRAIVSDHAEAYPARAAFAVQAVPLREQLTSNARMVLIVLFAAALLIFVVACANVANLILARTVRRESELAIRAALGADASALRKTLLAESLLLCGAGAALGVAIAWPLTSVLAQYGSRFSVRALDLRVDVTLLVVGVVLALAAAVLLAYAPTLPSADRRGGLRLTSSSIRIARGTRRQLNVFTIIQVAASFVLIAGAVLLLRTFRDLQAASPGFDTSRVLAVNVPVTSFGRTPAQILTFYRQLRERVGSLPGVEQVSVGSSVPWRDTGQFERGNFAFEVEGGTRGDVGNAPRARSRSVTPGYFATLGVPLRAGRDFNADDRNDSEKVVIISETIARQLFPGREAVNRLLYWSDPVMKFIGVSTEGRRIVGVVADVDDEHIVPAPTMTVYQPFEQQAGGGRVFVHTRSDPYAIVPPLTQIVREMAADQPVERASTLSDVRAEVLAPDRLNTAVFGLFAIVALMIAVVGVGGVLAFGVNGRTREFGIRLALGSTAGNILAGVLRDGLAMTLAGIVAGLIGGFAATRVFAAFVEKVAIPGLPILVAAAAALLVAALTASLMPAVRASRTNIIEALRAE
jgi:predicted permease